MATLYLSHSVSPVELGQVYALAQRLEAMGEQATAAPRNWAFDGVVPQDLLGDLNQAKAIVFFVTSSGRYLPWVNREFALAHGKPAVALVEQGVTIAGFPPERVIVFDKAGDINQLVSNAAYRIKQLSVDKQTEGALTALVVGGLILLILGALGGKDKQ